MSGSAPMPRWPKRYLIAHLQLVAAALVGLAAFGLLPGAVRPATRLLIGWNVAAIVYVAATLVAMLRASEQSMRRRSALSDESRGVVLILAILATAAALAAIFVELVGVKDHDGATQIQRVALSVFTIITCWAFIHIIFTQHYAHSYYSADEDGGGALGGLKFPGGDDTPDYIDFLYFAFTIGVASQTADVALTSRSMRLLALIHQILTFFFNTTILALTINIAASMI